MIKTSKISKHYSKERNNREEAIRAIGEGYVVKTKVVEVNGRLEVHEITSNGIIRMYNKNTKKLITKIIARPSQIKRYYTNNDCPQWLLDKAYEHTKLKLNKR